MRLNKSTLSEQIYQILRADILKQNIKLGEKLTLKTLQERFDVSSTPIREAITRLTEDGLVEYYTNVGVKVISLTKEDLNELFEFMGDLDSLAISYASASPNRENLLHDLEQVLQKTAALENLSELTPDQTQEWIENSDRFHLIFYDYCNNKRLKLAASKLRSQLSVYSNAYETQTQVQIRIDQMHHQIFEACKRNAFAEAAGLMKQHLKASLAYALSLDFIA